MIIAYRQCTFALQKCEPHPSPSVTPSPEGKAFEVLRIAKQQLIELFSGEISCILYLISHPYAVTAGFLAFASLYSSSAARRVFATGVLSFGKQ